MFARAAVRPGPGLCWWRGCCSPLAIPIAAKPKWDLAVQAMKSVQEELSASFWHISGCIPRCCHPDQCHNCCLSIWPRDLCGQLTKVLNKN